MHMGLHSAQKRKESECFGIHCVELFVFGRRVWLFYCSGDFFK
jgi:hypothetical protein